MDYLDGPLDTDYVPTGFEPLDLDDEEYDNEDEYGYDDAYGNADDSYDDEFDEPELKGFDDLRPFGSFSDGFGWDDGLF